MSETMKITEVTESDEWYYLMCDGTGTGLKKKHGLIPSVGDELTIHYVNGPFTQIRGMDVNGVRAFYKTDEELEAHRINQKAKYEQDQRDEFEKNKEELDRQYDGLPDVFKARIDRFRANNPNFRVEYERYEMFCCTEAVKIAEACKTPDEVKAFKDKSYEEQRSVIDEGHSGNTFGCAVSLAYIYLSEPESVAKVHGALSPLVGSEAYGDVKQEA